jgi:hypothetical protein
MLFCSCVLRRIAASAASYYEKGNTLTCYVNPKNPANILLSLADSRLRTVVGAVVPTMLLFVALCYICYLCAKPIIIAHSREDILQSSMDTGRDDGLQPPPRAMDMSSALAHQAGGSGRAGAGHGADQRCLTHWEANKVVAATTMPLGNAKLSDEAPLCVVCLDEIKGGAGDNSTVSILPCNHAFHPPCIAQWLTRGNTLCPCCNLDVAKIARGEPVAIASASPCEGSVHDAQTSTIATARQHTVLDMRGTRGSEQLPLEQVPLGRLNEARGGAETVEVEGQAVADFGAGRRQTDSQPSPSLHVAGT